MENNFKYQVFTFSVMKDFQTELNRILNRHGVIDFHSFRQHGGQFELIFKVEKNYL